MNSKSIVLFLIVLILFGCTSQNQLLDEKKKTCLVLSVGGMKGLSHIGAIDAINKKGITIDCVYGNSMGSVIGGIYAHSPKSDLRSKVKSFLRAYVKETEEEYKSKATSGFLFGAGLAILTGGLFGWETILGSTLINTMSVEKFDNDRFRDVLDKKLRYSSIENLPIPYATSYHSRTSTGIELRTISSGNLATAISRSSNNPFIFEKTSLEYIDPGLDRFSSVPIEDAIKQFKPDNVIAINVTGQPAVFNKYKKCNIVVINVDVDDMLLNDLSKIDQIINSYYVKGYTAVENQL